ncbi:MAG: PAS domain S-box protein, partial [Anaerolineae bacterium]
PLRVLILQDRRADAELMLSELRQAGYKPDWDVVETRDDYAAAVHRNLDVILADYALPELDAIEALEILKQRALDVPLIVVTNTAGEDAAVECMKHGAADYLLKDRLGRLGPAVEQARETQRLREQRRRAQEALQQSQERYRTLVEGIPIGLYRTTPSGRILHANQALIEMLGYPDRRTLMEVDVRDLYVDAEARSRQQVLLERSQVVRGFEAQLRRQDGSIIWMRDTVRARRDDRGNITAYEGSLEDITERKEAEEALRESEERYRRFFRTTRDCAFITSRRGTWIDMSDSAPQFFGYESREALEEVSIPDLYENPAEREAHIRAIEREGFTKDYAVDLRRKDGSVISTLITSVPVEDEAGDVIAFQGTIRDVTGRKRMEEALLESQERFETLFEFAPDGYYVSDLEGIFLDGNRATEELTGYDRDELVGKNFAQAGLLPADQIPMAVRLLAENALGKPTGPDEFTLIRKDGSVVPVEIRTYPTSIGGDRVVLGIARDVTGRKRAEEALEQQLARVSLLNSIAGAIAARHDLGSILRVVAQQLEDHFADLASIWLRDGESDAFTVSARGARSEETAAQLKLPERIAIPAEQPGLEALLEGKLVCLAHLEEVDVPALEPWLALSMRSAVMAPLTDEEKTFGVLVGSRRESDAFSSAECEFLLGLSNHVSLAVRQAQLYQDLQAAYDDLRRTQRAMMQHERLRALGEMASGIAHDVKNAISPIPLYTGLIRTETDLGERARTHLQIIERAVSDVEETVGRMRQFYRRGEDRELQPVDVNEATQQAIELTSPRWRDVPQEHGITVDLQTDLQQDLPPLLGNEGEIRQAVTNLILNAVDAMPDGGSLSLRTWETAGAPTHVILEVSDTGIGMDEETQERCFEPFFSTKDEHGTGMGLATVYGTMQRHGGDVQAESALGEGTTMRLIFPVREVVDEGPVEEVATPRAPLRILSIDDEPLLRDALKEALETQGHEVELADGGESGLEAFRAARERGEPFDAVITDLGMPHVDGREVARTVKEESPETAVILLTGWGTRLNAENDIPEAVDLMLSKPPTVEALNHALARATSAE